MGSVHKTAQSHPAKAQEQLAIVKCVQKAAADRELYRRLPKTTDMQEVVRQAYCIVQAAFDKYGDADTMLAKVWQRVNEAVVFAITYDTFCGRRGEWEKMKLVDMKKRCLMRKKTSSHAMIIRPIKPTATSPSGCRRGSSICSPYTCSSHGKTKITSSCCTAMHRQPTLP